jgi:hypothetical protein
MARQIARGRVAAVGRLRHGRCSRVMVEGLKVEMGFVEMLTHNRSWFCWTMCFFFGENVTLSASACFAGEREKC